MDITEIIRENFSRGYYNKAMPIDGLPDKYPAWTIKRDDWVGVAIDADCEPFNEKFAHAQIITHKGTVIDNKVHNLLILVCEDMELRNEFAIICNQFVATDEQGTERNALIANPKKWWENWKSLLGNSVSNKAAYSVLGELTMLEKLLQDGKHVTWTGVRAATHDLELDDCSIEVKSTIKRYGYEATISSVYQMVPTDKPLYLAFFRFEKSSLGRSVDDVAKSIKSLGYPSLVLEKELVTAGLPVGRTARNEKYKLLESKKYAVDEDFPAITLSSFKENKMPEKVIGITYTIDLSGVDGEPIV